MELDKLPDLSSKLKAAIYIRVSTEKQVKEGYGLEAQLQKCKAVVSLKEWEIYDVYGDKGVSGSLESKDREELARLIEDANKGLFGAVVFLSLDRLGRSSKIILDVIEQFKSCNLKIISHKEHIDTSTASGELMLTFFAGIAQYEKRTILERMSAGREVIRKKYGENGGHLPLGYKRGIGGEVHIDPQEAAIVTNIFMARDKGLTLKNIADWLNNMGIKTRKGKQWYGSTVNVIIKNRKKYEGGNRNNNDHGICWPKILIYHDDMQK